MCHPKVRMINVHSPVVIDSRQTLIILLIRKFAKGNLQNKDIRHNNCTDALKKNAVLSSKENLYIPEFVTELSFLSFEYPRVLLLHVKIGHQNAKYFLRLLLHVVLVV